MTESLIRNAVVLTFLVSLCFVFTGIGLLVRRRLIATFTSAGEVLFFSFGIGTTITGYAVFALAALQLLSPLYLWTMTGLLVGCAAAGWRNAGIALSLRSLRPHGWVETIAAGTLALLLGAAFLLALTPEIGKDALLYHLAAPKLYLKHQGFYFIPGNAFASYPSHADMLFLLGLFLHGDILAKLLVFATVPVILLGIRHLALHSLERNCYPYLGMLIFFMIPSVFQLAHMSYVELHITLYSLAGVLAYLNWLRLRETGWIIMCAIFTGAALACKYSTLLYPLLGFLGIVWGYRNTEESRPPMRDLSLYLAVTALFGLPFYVKNWLMTGNPLYPFMYGIFGGRDWSPELARLFDGLFMYMGMGRTWLDYLLLPWNISINARMDTMLFDGLIGPVFLLILPFLVGLRRKTDLATRVVLIFCGLNFLFWATSSQNIRYLAPLFALLAVVAGAILTFYRTTRLVHVLLCLGIGWCVMSNGAHLFRTFMKIDPMGVVQGKETREAFLTRLLSTYPMYRFVNDTLPPDAKLLLVFVRNWSYLCERESYADPMFEYLTLQSVLASSASPDEVRENLRKRGFTHIMYDDNHVTGTKTMLLPGEITLFKDFRDKRLALLKNHGPFYLYRL